MPDHMQVSYLSLITSHHLSNDDGFITTVSASTFNMMIRNNRVWNLVLMITQALSMKLPTWRHSIC